MVLGENTPPKTLHRCLGAGSANRSKRGPYQTKNTILYELIEHKRVPRRGGDRGALSGHILNKYVPKWGADSRQDTEKNRRKSDKNTTEGLHRKSLQGLKGTHMARFIGKNQSAISRDLPCRGVPRGIGALEGSKIVIFHEKRVPIPQKVVPIDKKTRFSRKKHKKHVFFEEYMVLYNTTY